MFLAVAGLVLVGGGAAAWVTAAPRAVPSAPPAASTASSASPPTATPALREAVPAPRRPGAPVELVVPALGVAAPVEPVRAPGGVLVPPSDPRRLGWWAGGARPGDARGSALVAGHTVHTGGGALDDLETLRRGAPVRVRTDRALLRYEVTSVRVFEKGRLARESARLFSQEARGRLVLLTCEDWDGSRYLANVVVVAEPTATP
ncbi:class F sortase [Nocardioides sp. Leaf285]|uniref:class F sortase n=1 Tax=Nocardioides sp. Leaf285 TaxID=1736322 RepID=UPI0009E8BC83|nr:class F sortase [Nocardioides sp. Leaf285]